MFTHRRPSRVDGLLRRLAHSAARRSGTPLVDKATVDAAEARAAEAEAELKALRRESARYVRWYRYLFAADRGVSVDALDPRHAAPVFDNVAAVRESLYDAAFARQLRRGDSVPAAAVATIRPLLGKWSRIPDARSFCHGLQAQPETRSAGDIAGALLAHRSDLYDLAWELFGRVPADLVAELAPVEFARTSLLVEKPSALDDVAKWVDDGRVGGADDLIGVAEVLFAAKQFAAAAQAADKALACDLDDVTRRRTALLRQWTERGLASAAAPEVPAGSVSFGVIDYKQPDEIATSSNLGDYVQTIASLGHLVRHAGLRFTGDPDLVEVVEDLHGRVRPELRVDGPGAAVHLTTFNRDGSSLDAVPEPTWAIAFGWYMQNSFGLHYDFPFHPNIRPLFISFHVNRPAMLTDEAVEYLRAHGPIGCRDWNTVYLLLNRGVPAFFSGCLTTTTSTVFPHDAPEIADDAPTVYVDTKAPVDGAETLTQAREDVRWQAIAPSMREALGLLERYRTDFGRVVTSRLHCYLPSWSIGANVEFTPKNRADVRFAGLLDADESDLRAMQERIRDLLAPVVGQLLRGAPEDTVYAEWRRVCQPEVDKARRAFERRAVELPLSFDAAEACRTARSSRVVVEATSPREGERITVAVALDANLKQQLEVVVGGLVHNSTRPLHVVALTRDHTTEDHQRLALLFPEVTFEWVACDDIDYGPVLGMLSHITVSTMDRLLLPELLPDVDRVLYHDIDALAVADVAPLFDVQLDGAPLAARSSVGHGVRSGLGQILKSGRRLSESPEAANEFLRHMYRRHPGDFRAFNAGILVMDLAVMRADRFTELFVPFVEHYGLNDQELLNAYAGSRYHELEPEWNNWPSQEVVTDPRIIHWAGHLKPWDASRYVALRQYWDDAAVEVEERRRGS